MNEALDECTEKASHYYRTNTSWRARSKNDPTTHPCKHQESYDSNTSENYFFLLSKSCLSIIVIFDIKSNIFYVKRNLCIYRLRLVNLKNVNAFFSHFHKSIDIFLLRFALLFLRVHRLCMLILFDGTLPPGLLRSLFGFF